MKYIDADRLRAEIEVIQNSLEHRDVKFDQVKQLRTDCMVEFCKMLNNVIDSLQQEQPEVDLEKEIEKYYYDNFAFISSAHTPTKDIVSDIASHFYELGQRKAAEMYDEIEYNRQRAEEESLGKTFDEAAEEYSKRVSDGHNFRDLTCGFIAGAKWMAGQGYSYRDEVYLLDGGDNYESYPGLDGEGEEQCINKAIKDGYLKVGDKVIVQIRKKEESK